MQQARARTVPSMALGLRRAAARLEPRPSLLCQYARKLASARELLGDQHPRTIATMTRLAAAYSDAGRAEEAEILAAEASLYNRQLYAS